MKKFKVFIIASLLLTLSLLTSVVYSASDSHGYMNIYNKNGLVLDIKNDENKNGTDIQLWKPINNRDAQLFSWKYYGNHKYSFISKIDGKYINIQRTAASQFNIKSGLNINVWRKNNSEAQRFCFIKARKGGYYIANYNNRNLVLTANGAYNGANVTLEQKKKNDPTQIWYLRKPKNKQKQPPNEQDQSDNTENPSSSKYVDAYIATPKGNGLVFRTGPSSAYSITKSIPRNTKVRIDKNSLKNNYYKAIYNGQNGYLYSRWISFKPQKADKHPAKLVDAHVIVGSGNTLDLKIAPSPYYNTVATVPNNTKVKIDENSLKNGYYKATYQGKKGYLDKDYLVLESDKLINGVRKTAPTKNNIYYYSDKNILHKIGYGPWGKYARRAGNCTWYALGRFYEANGKNAFRDLKLSGHAGTWATKAKKSLAYKRGLYKISKTPTVGALGVLSFGRFGHVFIVEKIENNKIYISDSSWGNFKDPDSAYIFQYHEMPSSWIHSNRIEYIQTSH